MAADYTATLATKRSAAAVAFIDDLGRVLLVEPTYKPYWELPGGAVEANESPYEAAAREVREELGLLVRPGRLLVSDWVPPRESRTEGMMFVFDGGQGVDTSAICLPPEELGGWRWCTVDEVDARMSPLLARRVRAALVAAGSGRTLYLENGEQVVG
ncbi:NUDIX domain-containing protein [Cryptosporangium phraense]|uniref:NUDIX hydrolase n=1 Tax=Cryptosporangium phraense TaxID=2593070 RepID=A0A545AZV6_9ACTN|nr:NUDIX hydrolase [Cryptosporangium phraense]TQS46852.1 NUDIX hydrolase [Cryptosporangium phraense]